MCVSLAVSASGIVTDCNLLCRQRSHQDPFTYIAICSLLSSYEDNRFLFCFCDRLQYVTMFISGFDHRMSPSCENKMYRFYMCWLSSKTTLRLEIGHARRGPIA